MAIEKFDETRSASCRFITGVDGEGKEEHMTRTISRFKVSATLDDVYEMVIAVAGLYPYTPKNINLNERCELIEGI